jgi:hypothetical protein
MHAHIDLDPGDYEVRVAVADQQTGAAGSVFAQIGIPKFATAPLSISDIAIEVGPNRSSPTGTPVSLLPTTRRQFDRREQARAFLQIYQGTRRTDGIVPVSVRVRILDARGEAARDQSLAFSEMDFAPAAPTAASTFQSTVWPPASICWRLPPPPAARLPPVSCASACGSVDRTLR